MQSLHSDNNETQTPLLNLYGIILAISLVIGATMCQSIYTRLSSPTSSINTTNESEKVSFRNFTDIGAFQDRRLTSLVRDYYTQEIEPSSASYIPYPSQGSDFRNYQKNKNENKIFLISEDKLTNLIKRTEAARDLLKINHDDHSLCELIRSTIIRYTEQVFSLIEIHQILMAVYEKLTAIKSSKNISNAKYAEFINPLIRFRTFTTLNLLEIKKYLLSVLIKQDIIKETIQNNQKSALFYRAFTNRYKDLTTDIETNIFDSKDDGNVLKPPKERFLSFFFEFQLLLEHYTMNLQIMMMWCFEIHDKDNPRPQTFLEALAEQSLNKEDGLKLKWEILNVRLKIGDLVSLMNGDKEVNNASILKLQHALIHKHLYNFMKLLFRNIEIVDIKNLMTSVGLDLTK